MRELSFVRALWVLVAWIPALSLFAAVPRRWLPNAYGPLTSALIMVSGAVGIIDQMIRSGKEWTAFNLAGPTLALFGLLAIYHMILTAPWIAMLMLGTLMTEVVWVATGFYYPGWDFVIIAITAFRCGQELKTHGRKKP